MGCICGKQEEQEVLLVEKPRKDISILEKKETNQTTKKDTNQTASSSRSKKSTVQKQSMGPQSERDQNLVKPIGDEEYCEELMAHQELSEELKEEANQKLLGFKLTKGLKKIQNINDQYMISDELGTGSFGSVCLATHRITKTKVAIKKIKKSAVQQHEIYQELMDSELHVLEELEHPNITRALELCETPVHYFVVMELVSGGDLLKRIQEHSRYTEKSAAQVMHQICLATNYLHKSSPPIVHRDLKLENVLCRSADPNDLNVKVTDFGFATVIDPEKQMNLQLGSPLYMAPELVREETYDMSVDVWAIGVLCYILITGRPPFAGRSKDETYQNICNKKISFSSSAWSKCSPHAQKFVQSCLQRDASLRPSVQTLLDHEWFTTNLDPDQPQEEVVLNVIENISLFRKASVLQSAVLGFISGMLSNKEELQQIEKVFHSLDTNKDGTLDICELKEGLKSHIDLFYFERIDWNDFMAGLDADKNGMIDFREFSTAAQKHCMAVNSGNLDKAFRMFDLNGDGFIVREEMEDIFARNSEFRAEWQNVWNQICEEADSNKDGKIDKNTQTQIQKFYGQDY